MLQRRMNLKPGTVANVSDWLARYWIGAGIAKQVKDGESTKPLS